MGSRQAAPVRHTLTLLFVLLAVGACGAKSSPEQSAASDGGAAAADPLAGALEWNGERMTRLTADLATAMRAVRDSFRKNPVMQTPDSPRRRTAQQMMEVLRGLDRHCASLAVRVARGENAEQTLGTARRIGTGLRDANMLGRRLMTDAWTDERILPAMVLINQIAPFYGRGPLYDIETLQMLDQGPNPNRRREGE